MMPELIECIIRDNGLTCFIPPCFKWDLLTADDSGDKIATVSEINLSMLELNESREREVKVILSRVGLHVTGYTKVVTSPEWHEDGVMLVVVNILGSTKVNSV